MTASKLDDAVVALAKAARVPAIKVDEGDALPLIDAMPSMSKAQNAACLGEAMDQFDWQGANTTSAFQAWAKGDLASLRASYRPPSLCLTSIPGGSGRQDRARAVWIKALSDALDHPGRTVAIADVSSLLEPSDLLAALRDRGGTVTLPLGERAPSPASMQFAGAARVEAATALDLVDATPERLQLSTTGPQPTPSATVKVIAKRGRTVDLADGDLHCVTEVSIGSVLPRSVCHTDADWKEIRLERDLANLAWQHNRQMTGRSDPAQP